MSRWGQSWAAGIGILALGGQVGAQTSAAPSKSETNTEVKTVTKPAAIIQLKLGLTGDFAYRFVSPTGDLPAPAPLPAPTGGIVALPVPASLKPEGATLQILDNGRGSLAKLPIKPNSVTEVGESLFRFVQVVYVPVQAKSGRPVTDAQVTLFSKTYPRRAWLLKPADNGIARFDEVPLDEPVTIGVSYAANPPKSVTETLSKAHPPEGIRREPILLDWADVKTTAPPPPPSLGTGAVSPASPAGNSSAASTSAAPVTPAPSPSPFSGILSTLVGLLFLGGVGYGLLYAYNNGHLSGVFSKLGINVAPPNTASDPAANPFAKPETSPITPITDGTADPLAGSGLAPNGGAPVTSYSTPSDGPRLVASAGVYSGSVFPLAGSSLDIGRDPSNGIPLPNDTNVSRRHATLRNEGGQFVLIDNGSSNGTFVNGVRIASQTPMPLRPGDEATIGGTRFRLEG